MWQCAMQGSYGLSYHWLAQEDLVTLKLDIEVTGRVRRNIFRESKPERYSLNLLFINIPSSQQIVIFDNETTVFDQK